MRRHQNLLAVLLALLGAATPLPAATIHHVVISGLGGEQDYEQRFSGWVKDLEKTLASSSGVAFRSLWGSDATAANIRNLFSTLKTATSPDDLFVLTLIGHGTFDGVDYKFNIPGKDLTASEIAALLDTLPPSRQLVVNTTSASGASVAALQRKNRIVIAATKSGSERNATTFARYWIEALRDSSADTDKNEVISALEAFLFASQKTAQFYDSQKRIATEHSLIEDTGEGDAVRAPSPQNGKGLLAANFAVLRFGQAQARSQDPALQKLYARREQLEVEIEKLKYQKAALPTEQYQKQLRALLLELAKIQAQLDQEQP